MKYIRPIVKLLLLLFSQHWAFSQLHVECATPPDLGLPETGSPTNPIKNVPPCNPDYMAFLPSPTAPIRYVKVNLHLVDTLGGGLNFTDSPAHKAYLAKAFRYVDTILGQVQPNPIPMGGTVSDSRIRLLFDVDHDLYLHQDEVLCHYSLGAVGALIQKYGVLPQQELNLFFQHDTSSKTGAAANGIAIFPSGNTISEHFFACIFKNLYSRHYQIGGSHRVIGQYLAHEIGHVLGLPHTFGLMGDCCGSQDDFDDTPPEFGGNNLPAYVPGTLGVPCVSATLLGECVNHSNNIMSYNWGDSPSAMGGRHLSTQQIALLNANLLINPDVHHYLRMADCTYHRADSTVITGTVVWNGHHEMPGDIIIRPGARLEVGNCAIVSMTPEARIKVMVGGELVVDGGIITSLCDELWKGIEVWGNPTQPQNATYPLKQGRVVVKNRARIEFARTAISTSRRDDDGFCIWANTGGGIIIANEGMFLYNRRAIEMMQYENGTPPLATDNLSRFDNCNFVNFTYLKGASPNKAANSSFVTLWGVRGVRFTHCLMGMQYPELFPALGTPFYHSGLAGRGILSVDASYRVRDCNFESMSKGVEFFSNSAGRTLSYRENTSNGVVYGLRAVGGAGHLVRQSNFFLSRTVLMEKLTPFCFGIAMSNTYGFEVRQNNVGTTDGGAISSRYSTPVMWGIIAHNSATFGGRILNNITTKQNMGIQTELDNPFLEITCNVLNRCGIGLAINPYSATSMYPATLGCGGGSLPDLENKFFNIDCPTSFFNYPHLFKGYNPLEILDYRIGVAPGYATTYPPVSSCSGTDVNITTCALPVTPPSCTLEPPPSGGGGGGYVSESSTTILARIAGSRTALAGIQAQYDQGQTAALMAQITGTSLSPSQLYDLLMASAPLSDDVVANLLAHSNRLSNLDLMKVLTGNSPLSYPNLLAAAPLEALTPQTLWKNLQDAQRVRNTSVALLRGSVAHHQGSIAADEALLLGLWLSDSTFAACDSARQYLVARHLDRGKREALTTLYLDHHQFDRADSLLALLPQATTDPEWRQMQQFLSALGRSGRNYYQLTPAELAWLSNLARGNGSQRQLASGILDLVADQPSWFEPELPQQPSPPKPRLMQDQTPNLQVVPNPSNGQVTLLLPAPAEGGITVQVLSLQGASLGSWELQATRGEAALDLGHLPVGVYICLATLPDGTSFTAKLAISH